ncbi:TIGR04388 family protein, partial [Leptospira yanagawae]
QALTSLQAMDQNYDKIINTANNELQTSLDMQMGSSGFIRVGDKYGKVSPSTGIPLVVRNYIPYKFRGIAVPKVKDSKGKSWDMTDLEALTSANGPSGIDLEAMAELAISGMENEFKKIYDPSRKVTYEQPSQFSNYRMVMAAHSQASSGDPEDPPVSFDIKDHYLVGDVVEGEFGKHNHDEFWDILSQKDTLDFLDQVVGKEQQRKAKKKADREGKIEAVVTVIAAVAATIITAGAAAPLIGAYVTAGVVTTAYVVAGTYVAYKSYQGYQAGGATGALLAAGTAAATMFTKGAVSVGGSYTKEQGFGFNVGMGITNSAGNSVGSVGIGFSEKGGFGFNAGVSLSENVGLNMNVHESGAWGVGLSVHQGGTNKNGDYYKQGLAMNIGYRETADGQVGLSGGFGYNTGKGLGTQNFTSYYGGLTFDSLLGNGVSLGSSGGTSNQNSMLGGFDGTVGWSTGGGFQSSLEMEFQREATWNLLKGNGAVTNQTLAALQEFDLVNADLPPLERAKKKVKEGLPLNAVEADAMEANKKGMEANQETGLGILNGITRQLTEKDDPVGASFYDPETGKTYVKTPNGDWMDANLVPKLVLAGEVKVKIWGPFSAGNPVHNNIGKAGASLAGVEFTEAMEEGLVSNDIPETFEKFLSVFGHKKIVEKYLRNFGYKYEDNSLTNRTHHGDLQNFHSMADKEGIPASVTKKKIIDTIMALYNLAQAKDTNGNYLLDQNTRERLVGSALHIIQDSYAKGHVWRNEDGSIKMFQTYEGQGDNHGHFDKMFDYDKNGAKNAMFATGAFLKLWKENAKPTDVLKYLDGTVYKLDKKPEKSGIAPGFEQGLPQWRRNKNELDKIKRIQWRNWRGPIA